MKSIQHLLSVLVICTVLSSCGSDNENQTDATFEDPVFVAKLQAIVDDKVGNDSDKLVGVSISIRVGETERLTLTGGLSKPGSPIQSDMRFGIASITKTAVAATILKLEEEGILSIHDKISKWLTINNQNIDPDITVTQLLQHFSGISDYFRSPEIWPMVEGNLGTAISPETVMGFIGEPVFSRGARWEYSNSNYLLLGLIIEAASGQSVGEAMRTRFWDPLQLNQLYFADDETATGPIAVPWRDGNGDGMLTDISSEYQSAYHSVFWTAADLFSTASDLSFWAYHLLGGNALTQESKDKMTDFFVFNDPISTGYGLGLRRVVLGGQSTWGHTGGMRGYGSYMFYDPTNDLSIAMLNNQSRSADGPLLRYELVNEIFTEVLTELRAN